MAGIPWGPRRGSKPLRGVKGKKPRRAPGFACAAWTVKYLGVAALFTLALYQSGLLCTHRASSSPDAAAIPRPISAGEAKVYIATRDLYNKIAFDDRPGGVWKQGYNVGYGGSEWDQERLKIFVVPHSHNNGDQIHTFEENYQERARSILDSVVEALKKAMVFMTGPQDARRKFIWDEVSYMERWWQDASLAKQRDFKYLVKSGQLEIVGGGWVMNDEANSHFYAILQQMMAGNMWVWDAVGATPKNGWAIDPAGHSPTMAYLLRRMGFDNMLIQRAHYEVKKVLALDKNLEFNWRQAWDVHNTTDIFCHMMPFASYDIPHTCGPDPGVCRQYDFWPDRQLQLKKLSQNVGERAETLLDQYRKKSTLFRTRTLLVPLGGDVRYTSATEAELQFKNYQKMFDHINTREELRAEAKFGTLDDYFRELRAETSRTVLSFNDTVRSSVPGFPSLSGDFFTYADRHQDYWSGQYAARPFHKAMGRDLERTLRAADMLFALTRANCETAAAEPNEFPLGSGNVLEAARRNLALFQHQGGVTGTGDGHVAEDSAKRMHGAIRDLQNLMAACVGVILSECSSEVTDLFEAAESRVTHDASPRLKTLELTNMEFHHVVVHNSLEETVEQVVTVVVDSPAVCVYDFEKPVESQVSPEWGADWNSTGRHRLQWYAHVPAMGLLMYTVGPISDRCKPAFLAHIALYNTSPYYTPCPPPYTCIHPEATDSVEISNERQTLSFDARTGLLRTIRGRDDGDAPMDVHEEFAVYSEGGGGGAHLFKPRGDAAPFVEPGGPVAAIRGPFMHELRAVPRSTLGREFRLARSARLYSGTLVQATAAEMEYRFALANPDLDNMVLIARFKTDLETARIFYTDLNGFQTIRRETHAKIPMQGNYYPMPALAFLQCTGGRRFSVHTRHALGAASPKPGWLELMLDRRAAPDDGRGLRQDVTDYFDHPHRVVLHLLLEQNTSAINNGSEAGAVPPRSPSLLSHRVGAHLNYPLQVFKNKPDPSRGTKGVREESMFLGLTHSPLRADLPRDLHVVSLRVLKPGSPECCVAGDPGALSFGVVVQRRGWDVSFGRGAEWLTLARQRWNFFGMFQHLNMTEARKTALNFVHDDPHAFGQKKKEAHGNDLGSSGPELVGNLELNPMELQAFKFTLRKPG